MGSPAVAVDFDHELMLLAVAIEPDAAVSGLTYEEAVDVVMAYASACRESLGRIDAACGFDGSAEPGEVEQDVILRLSQLRGEVYALRLPIDGLPWQSIRDEDGEAIRAAMRGGRAQFIGDKLHRVDPPAPRGFGVPFVLIGKMLRDRGGMPPALAVPGVVARPIFTQPDGRGPPENAQQAILSILWREPFAIPEGFIAADAHLNAADARVVLDLFERAGIARQDPGGWTMIRRQLTMLACLRLGRYTVSAGAHPHRIHIVRAGRDHGEWDPVQLRALSARIGRKPGRDDLARLFSVLANMVEQWGTVEAAVAVNDGVLLPDDAAALPLMVAV